MHGDGPEGVEAAPQWLGSLGDGSTPLARHCLVVRGLIDPTPVAALES